MIHDCKNLKKSNFSNQVCNKNESIILYCVFHPILVLKSAAKIGLKTGLDCKNCANECKIRTKLHFPLSDVYGFCVVVYGIFIFFLLLSLTLHHENKAARAV